MTVAETQCATTEKYTSPSLPNLTNDATDVELKKFFIFGQGISFSMSPVIHGAVFKYHSLPHTYEILQTETVDELSQIISQPCFGGASVTMPHKLSIGKFCSSISSHAQRIGAINTLIPAPPRHGSSKASINGDNTDWSGLVSCLKANETGFLEHATTGLVVGAGGASRAALYALFQLGVKNILLFNRTRSTAEKIAADYSSLFQITVLSNLAGLSQGQQPDIIIGTIPADKTSMDYFPPSMFGREKGICVDMAYKPRETPLLLSAAMHAGWLTVTGVEVLLEQAYVQSNLWLGLPVPKDFIARELQRVDEERRLEAKSNTRL